MVVGSKGWAERRYIREVKDVQGTSDTSRILKDIQKAFSRSKYRRTDAVPTVATSEVLRFECLSRCYSSAYTVVTSEVLRFECLSRCYSSAYTVVTSEGLRFECLSRGFPSAYSRHVGGSTLRVPVEVLLQCLQSPRRRFYASSACRGAITRRLSSQRRRFYAPSLKCHIRRDFKDTGHIAPPSATPSSEPERRPNISTTPRKDCELIPS